MLLMTNVQSSVIYKLRQKRHILRPFDVMNVHSDCMTFKELFCLYSLFLRYQNRSSKKHFLVHVTLLMTVPINDTLLLLFFEKLVSCFSSSFFYMYAHLLMFMFTEPITFLSVVSFFEVIQGFSAAHKWIYIFFLRPSADSPLFCRCIKFPHSTQEDN